MLDQLVHALLMPRLICEPLAACVLGTVPLRPGTEHVQNDRHQSNTHLPQVSYLSAGAGPAVLVFGPGSLPLYCLPRIMYKI